MKEISEHLPVPVVPVVPVAPVAPVDAPPLELVAEKIPKWPYLHPPAYYETAYDTKSRQIRRWVDTGKARARACPLDNPPQMAAWWRECMKHRVPDALAALEKATPLPPSSVMGNPITATLDPDLPKGLPEAVSGANPALFTSVDLAALELGEGQQVQQARQICAANFDQLAAAYKDGNSDAVRRWLPLWKNANDNLRLVEREDRESRKSASLLISRSVVLTEISQLLEALRQMRSGMPQKILSDLESKAPGRRRRIIKLLGPEILESVARCREREEYLFRNLESCQSPGEVILKLEAA